MSKLVDFLCARTGLTSIDVERIINRAATTYKSYTIPKRNGSGERIISQPAREVKILQRILMDRLQALPIHRAAMAYRSGVSIRENALRHVENGPILKYDFKSFFPSIRGADWISYCSEKRLFSDAADVDRSMKLFFFRPKKSSIYSLAIGAPSSPWLSNILLYEFDDLVTNAVSIDRVVYTRYADDLTFSAPRTGFLNSVDKILRQTVKELRYPRLKINEEKTIIATNKYRRVVTGLVLSNQGKVSIGRDKKRLIRAQIHRALFGIEILEGADTLLGHISHIRSVEPELYERLLTHYGTDFEEKIRVKYSPKTTF